MQIHFIARSRSLQARYGSWREAVPYLFGEPVRAIVRNVIVVGVGFLPLMAANLVPYQTVGVFIAAYFSGSGNYLNYYATSFYYPPGTFSCFHQETSAVFLCKLWHLWINFGECGSINCCECSSVHVNRLEFSQLDLRCSYFRYAFFVLCCFSLKKDVGIKDETNSKGN